MREARLECLCPEFHVADLNLRMRKGQVVFLPESEVDRSRDLAFALKINALSMQWVERCQVSKKPTPPWLNPKTRRKLPTTQKPAAPPVEPGRLEKAAREAAVEAVQREMQSVQDQIQQLTQAVRASLDRTVGEGPYPSSEDLQTMLRGLLSEALAGAPVHKQVPRAAKHLDQDEVWDDDEPRFIPTGIVDAHAKTNIDVSTESTTDSSLDEAAAALRGAKKPRRRRSKKKQE